MGAAHLDSSQQITDKLAQWLRPRHRRATFGILLLMGLLTALHFSNFQKEIMRSDLLDGEPCRPSQTQEIVRALNIEGLRDYELVNGSIMVPNMLKQKYYSALEKHGIPGFGTRQDDSLKSNFLLAPSERERIAKLRKRREVMDMIVRLPYVDEAWLECDSGCNGIFEPVKMSAVVVVQPKSEQILSWDNISTIRETIAGAFSGLSPEDIVLTDLNEGRAHPEDSVNGNVHAQSARWRIDRQRYYMKKIERILVEYPGIEIDVHVEQNGDHPGSDKLTLHNQVQPRGLKPAEPIGIASRIPTKDVNAALPRALKTAVPGANGTAAINVFPVVTKLVGHLETADSVDRLNESNERHAEPKGSATESVHVIIRIPARLLGTMRCPTDSANVTVKSADSKFKLIKDDIIKRVNPILPNAVAQNELPVAVVLEGEPSGDQASAETWNWLRNSAKRHWPLLAVGLLGFISVLFNIMRVPDLHPSAESTSNASDYDPTDSEELKSKLANLIDRDPETAAKVIKSWLRDFA